MKKYLQLTLLPLMTLVLMTFGFSGQVAAFDPFGGNGGACTQTNAEGNKSPVCATDGTNNPITGPDGVINKIANIFALVTGVAAVILIILGGFEYVRSGGDSSKISKAKNIILFAIIGLVIVVLARSIVALMINKL